MALLQKIKEKLGFGGGSSETGSADTEVTVEHEPDSSAESSGESAAEPSAEVDDDGAGDGLPDSDGSAADDPAESEPVATETEAAASTDSLVDEVDETDDSEGAAEPAEAAGGEGADVAVDDDDASAAVEDIKGIGPAYAERLAEIGIETVDDLADADPAEVAEGTSVGEKRAATWIERANEF